MCPPLHPTSVQIANRTKVDSAAITAQLPYMAAELTAEVLRRYGGWAVVAKEDQTSLIPVGDLPTPVIRKMSVQTTGPKASTDSEAQQAVHVDKQAVSAVVARMDRCIREWSLQLEDLQYTSSISAYNAQYSRLAQLLEWRSILTRWYDCFALVSVQYRSIISFCGSPHFERDHG